jgi:hypothetical protein
VDAVVFVQADEGVAGVAVSGARQLTALIKVGTHLAFVIQFLCPYWHLDRNMPV